MAERTVILRSCPHCHKSIPAGISVCPYCHRDDRGEDAVQSDQTPALASLEASLHSGIDRLSSEDAYIREDAITRLIQHGMAAVPVLVKVLNEQDRKGLADVARLLGRLRDRRAIPALAQALKIGQDELRTAAIWALTQFSDPQVLDELLQEIERPNTTVQGYIAHALCAFRDARVVPALLKLTCHSSRDVVFQAVWALGEGGDAAAVMPLRRLLGRKDPLIRGAAAIALRRLGGPVRRSVPWVGYALGLAAGLSGVSALVFWRYR